MRIRMEMRMSMRVRMRRRARGRRSRRRLMVRRKIDANGLPNSILSDRFVVREALFTAPWTPSGRLGGAIRNFGPPEGPPGPCTQAFCCSGGPVHHPLDSIWAPRGVRSGISGLPRAPLGRAPNPKGPPGEVLCTARSRSRGPRSDF